MTIQDRRLGRFMVARDMVADHADALRALMGAVVVLEARFNVANETFEYVACSPHFGMVPSGEMIPLYKPFVTQSGPLDQQFIHFDRMTTNEAWLQG